MRRLALLFAAGLAAACSAAQAVVPLTHPVESVFQVYAGDTNGSNRASRGIFAPAGDATAAAAGILTFDPGPNWANFITATRSSVPYTVKTVTLTKQTPSFIQCSDVYYPRTIRQQGVSGIRTWWPLMYEAPGTTWTLSILYGTSYAWDDDGAGPNPAGYVHNDIWTWKTDADLASMRLLLTLFRQLPFGMDEVPLISDESLYITLHTTLMRVQNALRRNDKVSASLALQDFELRVQDACIGASPQYPNASGPGTGIAQTLENPACCKLLIDAEYVARKLGLFF